MRQQPDFELLAALVTFCPKPMLLLFTRCSMILSRPTKAPPHTNRMLVVSIWRNSCCGCLRPPFGGTLATVPSMILSNACWTPSPETSRVMLGFSPLRLDLVDLVDVDDALHGPVDVVVGDWNRLRMMFSTSSPT